MVPAVAAHEGWKAVDVGFNGCGGLGQHTLRAKARRPICRQPNGSAATNASAEALQVNRRGVRRLVQSQKCSTGSKRFVGPGTGPCYLVSMLSSGFGSGGLMVGSGTAGLHLLP